MGNVEIAICIDGKTIWATEAAVYGAPPVLVLSWQP